MIASIQCQVKIESWQYEPETGRIYDVKLVIEDPAFSFESAVDFDKLDLHEQQYVLRLIREQIPEPKHQ